MTDPNPDLPASVEAPESPPAPPAPEVQAAPLPPSEPALEPAVEAPEAPEPAAGDEELEFDDADREFAAYAVVLNEHPSRLPVALRPAPAGPSSQPPDRVARARDENR